MKILLKSTVILILINLLVTSCIKSVYHVYIYDSKYFSFGNSFTLDSIMLSDLIKDGKYKIYIAKSGKSNISYKKPKRKTYIRSEFSVKNNKLHGEANIYYKNFKERKFIEEKRTYLNGKLHGEYLKYYNRYQLAEKGWFKENLKDSLWISYEIFQDKTELKKYKHKEVLFKSGIKQGVKLYSMNNEVIFESIFENSEWRVIKNDVFESKIEKIIQGYWNNGNVKFIFNYTKKQPFSGTFKLFSNDGLIKIDGEIIGSEDLSCVVNIREDEDYPDIFKKLKSLSYTKNLRLLEHTDKGEIKVSY